MYSFAAVLVTSASDYTGGKRMLQALRCILLQSLQVPAVVVEQARNSRNGRVGLSFSFGTA